MSVFARADVAGISVSPEHGGCGQFHSRPVVQGAPAALWQLDCPKCEDHLRSDPLWSSNVSQIPETPDEVAQHDDWKRRSEKDTQFLIALALAKLSGQDVPESMMHALSGSKTAAITGSVLCSAGHENRGGARFCSECGAPMGAALVQGGRQAPAIARAQAAEPVSVRKARSVPVEPEDEAPAAGFVAEEEAGPDGQADAAGDGEDGGEGESDIGAKLESLPLSQLKALAQQAGVAVARTKADQIAALRAAGL